MRNRIMTAQWAGTWRSHHKSQSCKIPQSIRQWRMLRTSTTVFTLPIIKSWAKLLLLKCKSHTSTLRKTSRTIWEWIKVLKEWPLAVNIKRRLQEFPNKHVSWIRKKILSIKLSKVSLFVTLNRKQIIKLGLRRPKVILSKLISQRVISRDTFTLWNR